ncbi:unnamed protein product [Ceratitis capitata]|uniref:(Mediterranean fruit fly) hypothetical protein n=1 Tax=Ceratitis capitata TaxID=7213 RepID=A0A811VAV6_CERCA|nr:unnamed protein product [Ceratitis capitata]
MLYFRELNTIDFNSATPKYDPRVLKFPSLLSSCFTKELDFGFGCGKGNFSRIARDPSIKNQESMELMKVGIQKAIGLPVKIGFWQVEVHGAFYLTFLSSTFLSYLPIVFNFQRSFCQVIATNHLKNDLTSTYHKAAFTSCSAFLLKSPLITVFVHHPSLSVPLKVTQ